MSLMIPQQTAPGQHFTIRAIKDPHEAAITQALDFVGATPLGAEADHNRQLFDLASGNFPDSLRALRELAVAMTGQEMNAGMAGSFRLYGNGNVIQPDLMFPEEQQRYVGQIATFMLWKRESQALRVDRTTITKQHGVWTLMTRDPGVEVKYGEPHGSGNVRDFVVFGQRAGDGGV